MATKKMLSYKVANLSPRMARRVRNACVQYFGVTTEDIGLTFHNNTVDSTKGPIKAKHGHDSLCEWHLSAHPDKFDILWGLLDRIPSESLPDGVEIQPIDRPKEYCGVYRILHKGGAG